ncbi:MAG: hypothetical protein IPL88_01590 [Rhizobiales bacterium]|nr:hypothetical protein [Hyphomicrobiales bacterium]
MISALIVHERPEPALALTLSRLVEGVLDGLLSDVAILDGTCDPLAEKLADEGGCALVRESDARAGWRAGVAALRGEWIMTMRAGLAPTHGWTGAVREAFALAAAGRNIEGVALRAAGGSGVLGLAKRWFSAPPAVLLAPRATLLAAASAQAFEAAPRRGWRVVDGHVVDERAQ